MTDSSRQPAKEHYRTLDVPEDAAQEEIAQQYQRLLKLYQPELLESPEDRAYAEQKLTAAKEAYAVLGDRRGAPSMTAGRPRSQLAATANRKA